MNFKKHSDIEGLHAFLGASKYNWINYDDDHLVEHFYKSIAAQKGTETHDFASLCIKRGQKLPKQNKTLNLFVNDAIGFKMNSEQVLYFSDNCFGTADAISFRDNLLRIHDLKTGTTPAHMEQLYIYAALFCLEYGQEPENLNIECRIYQNDQVLIDTPDGIIIRDIMSKIRHFDEIISKIRFKEQI